MHMCDFASWHSWQSRLRYQRILLWNPFSNLFRDTGTLLWCKKEGQTAPKVLHLMWNAQCANVHNVAIRSIRDDNRETVELYESLLPSLAAPLSVYVWENAKHGCPLVFLLYRRHYNSFLMWMLIFLPLLYILISRRRVGFLSLSENSQWRQEKSCL